VTDADEFPASDIDERIGTPPRKPREEERRHLDPVWTEAQLEEFNALLRRL
jgi:hypothetical protein